MRHRPLMFALCILLASFTPARLGAQESPKPDTTSVSYEMPQVDIIGTRPGILERTPGSANIVSQTALQRIAPITGNEVFKTVTGLHAVDEEGVGLRLNLGVRGLDPDRSRGVLMMEDGVPIALAPYGEPEMYYTPSIDRMARLEILKGSGSILFGPQTIGGVINYLTSDPPLVPSGSLSSRVGREGFFTTLFKYGTTSGNVGAQINLLRRQADNLVTTRFRVNDISSKLKLVLGEKSILGIKIGAYDEVSNSTYIGLTQTMYDRGEYFTRIAPHDELQVRRYSGSATHNYMISPSLHLRTTVFGYTTTRNWRRQEFGRTSSTTNQTGVIFGDTSVAGGALYMRNETGNRNRQFEVGGVEPRVSLSYMIGDHRNELDFGARFLYERAFEQLVIGTTYNSSSGTAREDEIRTGYARSAFAQNRFYVTDRLVVTPGVRLESFSFERDIRRGRFNNVVRDTSIVADDKLFQVIPGIGASYKIGDGSSVFAGVHRGFAPPRIKDAITNTGEALDLDAELSWNYEVGTRLSPVDGLSLEITGFLMDFTNQIIPVSQSSGGTGSGLVNGGRSKHIGFEGGFSIDLGELLYAEYPVFFTTNITHVRAIYNADRFVRRGTDTINIKGNRLPYSPGLLVSGTIGTGTPFGATVQISGNYVAKQFADELNTVEASANGLTGEIPAYFTVDLSARYLVAQLNTVLHVSVKNAFDKRYIASRRPAGIRVGMSQTVAAGVDIGL